MEIKYLAIFIVLPLLALIFIGLWQSGMLDNIEGVVEGIMNNTPDISVGLDETQANEITLPGNIGKPMTVLKSTLEAMAKSKKTDCFQKFGGFQAELGEDEVNTASIILVHNSLTNAVDVTIRSYKGVVYDKYPIPDISLCVIAGTEGKTEVADVFNKRFIQGQKNALGTYFKPVDSLVISYSTKKLKGNRISSVVGEGFASGKDPVNDESDNYDSDGILFKTKDPKTEGASICFLPTNKWFTDKDGIKSSLVSDNSDEDSLAWKLEHSPDLQQCDKTTLGYEAVELFGDDDASGSEFDCEMKDFAQDGQKNIYAPLSSLAANSGEDGDCKDLMQKHMTSADGTITLPEKGCWALLSEDDDFPEPNDCGWVEIGAGEVIPSYEASEGRKLYPFGKPKYEITDPLCLLNFYAWKTSAQRPGALLCDGISHKWYSCDEDTYNEKEPYTKKMSVENKEVISTVTYTCTVKNKIYTWEADQKDVLPWFTYYSLELFADSDNSYPGSFAADTPDYNSVFFACDARGRTGEVKASDYSGSFPCPTEGNDCDSFALENKGYYQKDGGGCNLFLSEDDPNPNSNDCGAASVPIGTHFYPLQFNTLYACDGSEESCSKGPLAVWGNSEAKSLLQHSWKASRYGGEFLCAEDWKWYLCEERKLGSYIPVKGQKLYCNKNETGQYVFS